MWIYGRDNTMNTSFFITSAKYTNKNVALDWKDNV
jgi:hypothetical protein